MKIDVCFTPNDYNPNQYTGYNAVVIDVLRATTSIATALQNGCHRLVPAETVADAQDLKLQHPEALLAGERKGLHIPGFNIGNSPYEYTRELIAGKTIIMTTTNGTIALNKASAAVKIFTAAFVNAAAVAQVLRTDQDNIVMLCAGSEGSFSLEDALCAGLLVERLSHVSRLSDTALAVQAMYRDFNCDLIRRVSASSHARYLYSIGFGDDVAFCLEHDTLAVVPVFANGIITA